MRALQFSYLWLLLLICGPLLAAPTQAPSARTAPVLVLQSGHQIGVVALAFSPDGQLAASIARQGDGAEGTFGEFKLWNARTGALIRNFPGAPHAINALAFSPDSTLIATAQFENNVTLWSVALGQIHKRLWAPRPVSHLVWTRGAGLIGAEGFGGGLTGKLFLWDATLSRIRYFLPSHDAKPFANRFEAEISPLQVDAAGAVLSVKTANAITVWDLKKRARLARIGLDANAPDSSFFAPTLARDGETLAMNVGGRATQWKARTGQKTASWPLNFRQTLSFAPDGKTLFCRDFGSGTVERRQALTGQLLQSIAFIGADRGGVGALAFSPDGRVWAAAGNYNPFVSWWRDGKQFAAVEALNSLTDLFFQPQSDIMGWSQDNGAFYFWNWKTGRLSHFFALKNQESFRGLSAAFSRDGATLFVTVEAELLCLDARSGALRWKTPQLGESADMHLAVAPDGKTVATAGLRNQLRVWDAATGREIVWRETLDAATQKHEAHGALSFSNDGNWLLIGGDSNAKAALFDVEARRFVRELDTFSGADVGFSDDAKTVVIADGFRPSIEVFDATSGAKRWQREQVFGFSFRDDNRLVLRTDGSFIVASALTGQTLDSTPDSAPVGDPDLSGGRAEVWLRSTPDNQFWVGKGSDEILRFWSATTGKQVLSLAIPALPDRASPHWLAFTPDGLYTGSPGIENFIRHRSGTALLTREQTRALFRPQLPPPSP